MARRKSWMEKATRKAILKKVNRKNNPITSLVQLAEEFGAPVYGPYRSSSYGWISTRSGRTAHPAFRAHVKAMVGLTVYNSIRASNMVR